MNDGSFTTSISAADLSPAQRTDLEERLRAEGIPVTWLGGTIHIDQAFESRVETLLADTRAAATATTPAGGTAGGFVPTAVIPPPPGGIAGYPYPAPGYAPVGSYPPPYPAPYPAGSYLPKVTNSNATISLVLGILAWTVCPLTAIFGVIYGRRAQDEIDASGGTQSGEGMAKAGLIMSWVLIGLYGLMIVGFVVFTILAIVIGIASS